MNANKPIVDYAIAIACLKGISLLMLPVITRYLPSEVYGELNFLVSLVALLSIVLSFGMAEMLFRFTPSLNTQQSQAFIADCIKVTVIVGAVFYFICLVGSHMWVGLLPINVKVSDFLLITATLCLNLIVAIFLTQFRLKSQSKLYMYTALFQGGCQAVLTVLLLHWGYGLTGVLISGAITAFLLSCALLVRYRVKLCVQFNHINKTHIKYGLCIALSGISVYCLGGAENWIIVSKLGSEVLATYFIATQFALVVSLAFEPFRMWWFPLRFKYYQQDRTKAANGAVIGCYVISLFSLIATMIGPAVIIKILPEPYHASADYLPILCLILVIKTYSELLNLGCYLDKTAKYVPIINSVCGVFAICSIWVAVDHLGLLGVFVGLATTHMLRLVFFYVVSQKLAYLAYKKCFITFSLVLVVFQVSLSSQAVVLQIGYTCLASILITFFIYQDSKQLKDDKAKQGGEYEFL